MTNKYQIQEVRKQRAEEKRARFIFCLEFLTIWMLAGVGVAYMFLQELLPRPAVDVDRWAVQLTAVALLAMLVWFAIGFAAVMVYNRNEARRR